MTKEEITTYIELNSSGLTLSGDTKFLERESKVFINNHEITDIDTFFKVAEENTKLQQENKQLKERIKEFENFVFEIYKDNFHCTKNWYLNELLHNYFDDLNFATDFKLQDILKESESE